MKKLILILALLFTTACASQQQALKVGTTQGTQLQILEYINKTQMPLEIVVFKDYNQLNLALKEDKIQLNLFQNQIYLQQNNQTGELIAIEKCYLSPLGLYSKKHQKLEQLSHKITIAIPDDDIGKMRATELIKKTKLKNFELQPIDLNKPLNGDVDLVMLPLEYALKNKFTLDKALMLEDTTSPFTQIMVTNTKNQTNPKIKEFIKAYQSEQTKEYIKKQFPNIILAF